MYNSIPLKSNAEAKEFLQIDVMISSSIGIVSQFRIDVLRLSRYSRLVFAVFDSDGSAKIKDTKVRITIVAISAFFFVVYSSIKFLSFYDACA